MALNDTEFHEYEYRIYEGDTVTVKTTAHITEAQAAQRNRILSEEVEGADDVEEYLRAHGFRIWERARAAEEAAAA